MTLEDLDTRCKQEEIQYAYGAFQEPVSPPHLVALETETDNFMADNKVFSRKGRIQLDLTMDYMDFGLIDKVENKRKRGILKWQEKQKTRLNLD